MRKSSKQLCRGDALVVVVDVVVCKWIACLLLMASLCSGQAVFDNTCGSITLRDLQTGFTVGLLDPFDRTPAVYNSAPVFQQQIGSEFYLFAEPVGSGMSWIVASALQDPRLIYAYTTPLADLPDITTMPVIWNYKANGQNVQTPILVECSVCSTADYYNCAAQTKVCISNANNKPVCACDPDVGLQPDDHGGCVLDIPPVVNVTWHAQEYLIGERVLDEPVDGLSLVYRNNRTGHLLTFRPPDIWTFVNATKDGIFGVALNRSLNVGDITRLSAFGNGMYQERDVEFEVSYCRPSECPARASCRRPTRTAPLECFCDPLYMLEANADGSCSIVPCPEVHISNFVDIPNLQSIYVPVDGLLTENNFPVYTRLPSRDLYLYRLSGFWLIGRNYSSLQVFAYSTDIGAINPADADSWLAFVDGAFKFAQPVLSCRSCLRETCPGNLQCIFDNAETNELGIEAHACGCPPPFELNVVMGVPHCTPPDEPICQIQNIVVGTGMADGRYIQHNITTDGYPIYYRDSLVNRTLTYDLDSRAWQIEHDDGTVEAFCFTANYTPTADCAWYRRSVLNPTGPFELPSSVTVECIDCLSDQMCSDGELCVLQGEAPTCVCPFELIPSPDTGRCVKRDEICDSIDVNIPQREDLSGVYEIIGTIAGRPYYGATIGGALFTVSFSTSVDQWVIVKVADRLTYARRYSTSFLPIDEPDSAVRWAPYKFGSGYVVNELSTSHCAACTPYSCPTGQICRSPVPDTAVCDCDVQQFFQDDVCVDRPACQSLLVFLNNQTVATLQKGGVANGRPVYSGNLLTDDFELHLRFSTKFDLWYLTPRANAGFFKANTTYFLSTAFYPEDIIDATADFDVNLQLALGFVPTTYAFVCETCTPDYCQATETCETAISREPTCICGPGLQRFQYAGGSFCQVPSFAEAEPILIIQQSAGPVEPFYLVYDQHINGRFFYRAATKRRETRLVFWLISAETPNGIWAIGTLNNVESTATKPGLPHQTSWTGGFTIRSVCPLNELTVTSTTPTTITVIFDQETAENTTVLASTSELFAGGRIVSTPIANNLRSMVISGLDPETKYYLLAYVDQSNCFIQPPSGALSVSTPAGIPLDAPEITSADAISSSAIFINFTQPQQPQGMIAKYIVFISSQNGHDGQRDVSKNSRTALLTGLQPFTTYTLRMAAVTSAGQGPTSVAKMATTFEAVPATGGTIVLLTRAEDGDITALVQLPPEEDHNGVIDRVRVTCVGQTTGTHYSAETALMNTNATMFNNTLVYNVVLPAVPQEDDLTCSAETKTSAGWSPSGPPLTSAGTPPAGSSSKSNAGAVAAGVIVPLLLLLTGTVAFLVYRNKCDPKRIYTEPNVINMTYTNSVFETERFNEVAVRPKDVVLQERLGEGQFGMVRAGLLSTIPNQPPLDHPCKVAAKFLKPTADMEDRRLFLDEAWRMRPLVHRHVVQLLAVCLEHDPPFIVLEYMDGGDLENFLRDSRGTNGAITEAQQLDFAHQVCSGLAYLGSVKFVHRDLAARNILMTRTNILKIGDFGLARNVQGSAYYVSSKRRELPLRWMAPEAVLQNRYTHLSDVYSFGVVLYEIFTYADFPWAGFQDTDIVQRLRQGEHMPLDGVPGKFWGIILECWKPVTERPTADVVRTKLPGAMFNHYPNVEEDLGIISNPAYSSLPEDLDC
eukprot:m.32595 g.32595  ORF g.32595 m.32595 type:complete len:1677 (+) comp10808_c1_seq2:137-5167(+)